jgi:hypothetical protein
VWPYYNDHCEAACLVNGLLCLSMKKYLLLIMLIMSKAAFADPLLDNGAQAAMLKEYCARSVGDADISNELFDTMWYADILLKLNSKNIESAIRQIVADLRIKIILLNEQLKSNPCNARKSELDRIYPMLRVIAAVSNRIPISDFEKDLEIKAILDKAIGENPEHYKKLVERSKEWDGGVK